MNDITILVDEVVLVHVPAGSPWPIHEVKETPVWLGRGQVVDKPELRASVIYQELEAKNAMKDILNLGSYRESADIRKVVEVVKVR